MTGGTMVWTYFGHGLGDAEQLFQNVAPAADYYGTLASHWGTDVFGHGVGAPPDGHRFQGALNRVITLDQPPAQFVIEHSDNGGGALFEVGCGTQDATAPCKNGKVPDYSIWRDTTLSRYANLHFNANTQVLEFDPDCSVTTCMFKTPKIQLTTANAGCASFDAFGNLLSGVSCSPLPSGH